MDLLKAYEANTVSFIELIKKFPDSYFNSKPNDSTWSAAENVDHIIRSEFGTARLFNSGSKKDPTRDTEEKIKNIETQFLDRTQKFQAFGVVLPSDGEKSKNELIMKFQKSREQITELLQIQDLDEVCMRFEHPLFGHLTRREWIHFNIVHTKRHMAQIEALQNQLK